MFISNNQLFHKRIIFAILFVLIISFGAPQVTFGQTGSCGNSCYSGGTCDSGLTCSGSTCIIPQCDTNYPCTCVRTHARDSLNNIVRVSAGNLCGTNCNTSPCKFPICTSGNNANITGPENTNRGGAMLDSGYVVIGVTPEYDGGPANLSNVTNDPTCGGAGGYCTYFTTQIASPHYRDIYFILATPTVVPTNTPTPTLYPTAALSGSLNQQGGAGSCNSYSSGPTPAISLNTDPTYASWVTTSCTNNVPAATYQCTISYDNQANPSLPSTINETLSSNVNGLVGNWQNNSCGGAIANTLGINVGTVSSQNIYFGLSPWVKLVNGSLATPGLSFTFIPNSPVKFIADPSSDPGNSYLLDQSSANKVGVAINSSSNWGVPTSPTSQISQPDWRTTSYAPNQPFLGTTNFTNYLKARKQFTNLGSPPGNLTGLSAGIYYYSGSGTTLAQAPTNDIILVVDGNVFIKNNLTPGAGIGFALIVSGSITLDNSVTTLNGIYTANSVTTGTASSLEVKGNLVSASPISNNLVPTNNLAPSMLVVFDPTQYINLLPYLSISKYNWQLLQ